MKIKNLIFSSWYLQTTVRVWQSYKHTAFPGSGELYFFPLHIYSGFSETF